jgi:hypothetical protein
VLLPRVDYVGRLVLVQDGDATEPSPGHVPAEITPEGYLDAWALTARDGLLTYSDGLHSWQEYRPREELEASLEGWAHVPVTDGHPPAMVTASTWAQYARGHALGEPELVELDGVTYIRKRLRFADAALVGKVQSGEQVELSIGFLSDVLQSADYSGDAQGAAAVQTEIVPNHDASVPRGRAGPRVRVLLDGVDVPVCWPGLESGLVPPPDMADIPKTPAAPPQGAPTPKPKTDEVGSPVETIEVPGPDGKMYPAPSFMVAELEQLRAMHKGAPAAAAPPVVPDAAGAPMPPPAGPPMRKPEDAPMDAIDQLRRRSTLERRAVKLSIPDAKIDAADTLEKLELLVDARGREVVAAAMPHAKDAAAAARGDALGVLVDVALAVPRTDAQPGANPWAKPAPIVERTDATDAMVADFRKRQGFED